MHDDGQGAQLSRRHAIVPPAQQRVAQPPRQSAYALPPAHADTASAHEAQHRHGDADLAGARVTARLCCVHANMSLMHALGDISR